MAFLDLQDFLGALERSGQLRRVAAEVDPELEITEIATRVIAEQGPALLFERVKGSPYPLAINILGSFKRIEMALGREPATIGRGLIEMVERINPPSLKSLWRTKGPALRLLLSIRPNAVRSAICQEVVEPPDLGSLPALKCWPEDGGRFLTLAQVLTHSPSTRRSNLGIYRMQVHDMATTGMHWQIQKGGGFHYAEAEALGKPLDVAAVLGGDPALILAAVLPLPEGIEELLFSGILRGRPTPMVQAKTLDMRVPANAEFVLEGQVPPGQRAAEGPFGDHFGYYSEKAAFPVFRVQAVTRRRRPVYPASVVGKPPQEDRYLGDAAQEILNPLVKLTHPEIEDLWAYYEAGFQNLLVASVRTRYAREPMKTALGLLGEGQISLSKCVVLVGPGVNVRDFRSVLREVSQHFSPEEDFLLLPRVPLDTLDFTSFKMHLGSKMVVNATPGGPALQASGPAAFDPKAVCADVQGWRLLEDALLAVQVSGPGREPVSRLVEAPQFAHVKAVAAVSPDVDLDDMVQVIWGIFTRFDPARDVVFPSMRLAGAAPVYRGPMGIDATYKPGYPAPVAMEPSIKELVSRRWDQYRL